MGRIEMNPSHQMQIFFTDGTVDYEMHKVADLITASAAAKDAGEMSVCVIENVWPEAMNRLVDEWHLDPAFYQIHTQNLSKEKIWDHVEFDLKWSPPRSAPYSHLDGVYEYHGIPSSYINSLPTSTNVVERHVLQDPRFGLQSTTRISYYRVHSLMYLFLVDAPTGLMGKYLHEYSGSRPSLRLPYAMNRGGISLPQLLTEPRTQYSLYDALKNFFMHGWHLDVLFDPPGIILPPQPFIYLLSSSVFESNLRLLTNRIERVSFQEIRSPSLALNETLHDQREELVRLKRAVEETTNYAPEKVKTYFCHHPYYESPPDSSRTLPPIEEHIHILKEAEKLEDFLMQTFQLFMSSISVQDSQASIEQARRSVQITLLAFVYVPLSFVTGIFGMNIRELNGTGVHIWACLITLAVVILITTIGFWLMNARIKRKAKKSISVQTTV